MSIHKDDAGYHKRSMRYKILFNGIELLNCFTADEDRGYALVHKTDENGNILLNKDRTEILTEKRYGKVDIKKVR